MCNKKEELLKEVKRGKEAHKEYQEMVHSKHQMRAELLAEIEFYECEANKLTSMLVDVKDKYDLRFNQDTKNEIEYTTELIKKAHKNYLAI